MSHFIDSSLCDLLHNNISECFNNFSVVARDQPIITCLEMLHRQLMIRFEKKMYVTVITLLQSPQEFWRRSERHVKKQEK